MSASSARVRRAIQSQSSRACGGPRTASRSVLSAAICAALLLGAASASAGPLTAHSAGKTVSLPCRGGGKSCTAVVSLAGGASNEKLRIALSDTNFKLVGVVAKPAFIHGAYMLSSPTYSLGGSLYTATLNAVQSIPKGATLTLQFAAPAQALACKSVTAGISHLTIAKKIGFKQSRGAYGCQQANAVSNTWALRFQARQQVQAFSVNDIRYSCKLVPVVPENTQCDGGGVRVKFAAPTGH